jgi:hypothetical protein
LASDIKGKIQTENIWKRVLRGDEVIEGWRKLHIDKLHHFYSWLSIIKMMDLRRMGFVGQFVTFGAEEECI